MIASRAPGVGDESRRSLAIKVLERTGAEGRAILETLRMKAPTWRERQAAASSIERLERKE